MLGGGFGQHGAAEFPRVGAEACDELFDSGFVLRVGSGDQQDVIDEAGKKARDRIAAQLDRGDDHHVEAFGLVERLFDVRLTDRSVAPTVRRDKRRQIEVGLPVPRDHVGQCATAGGDIDKPGLVLIGIDGRQSSALQVRVDQQHALRCGRDRGKRQRDRCGVVLIIGSDDQDRRIAAGLVACPHRIEHFADFHGET